MFLQFKLFSFSCMFLSLLACERGDRGGISIADETKPIDTSILEREGDERPMFLVSTIGKCLQIDSRDYLVNTDFASVQSWDCFVDSDYQQWRYSLNQEIVSKNGLCLALGQEIEPVGFYVNAALCDGGVKQRWNFNTITATVTNVSMSDQCLGVEGGAELSNGDSIIVSECRIQANQKWIASELENYFIGNVLDTEKYINIEEWNSVEGFGATQILNIWWSAHWLVEPTDRGVRIRNRWKPERYLNITDGALEASTIDPFGLKSSWILVEQVNIGPNVYQIQSALDPEIYIGLDENYILKAARMNELLDGSSAWEFSPLKGVN